MGKYLKNGNWFIDYYANGKRKREKIGSSKVLAETVLKKRKVEIAEGKFLDIKKEQKVKFEELAQMYINIHARPNKRSCHSDEYLIKTLGRFFGGKYLYEITTMAVDQFKAERAKEVSLATVNRALACLKCMFNKAIEWGKAEVNPAKKVKLFKENNIRVRYLEKEEIRKLINNATAHLKPILIVALNTGMRKGEILNLKWHDLDFKNNVIFIRQSKSGEKREVPMNPLVRRT